MSKTALAIALVLLVGLAGLGAILLTRPAPGATGPVRLLPTIPPERVSALTIGRDTYTRDGAEWRTPSGWPARTDRLRALLRSLSGLTGPAADPGASMTDPVDVTLTIEDGTTYAVVIDRSAFAGTTLARTDRAAAEIDAGVANRLPEGDFPWHVRTALPGLDPMSLRRMRIETDAHTLDAKAVEGRWYVAIEPGEYVRANSDALLALAGRFRTIRFEAFDRDRLTGTGAYGLRAVFEGRPPTRMTHDLSIALDPPGEDSERLASVDVENAGRDERIAMGGRVSGIDPAGIPVNPIVYAARTATDELRTNVRTIEVARAGGVRIYTRTLDGWASDEDTAFTSRDPEALLDHLITTQGVPGAASEAAFDPRVTVRLLGDDGGLLQAFTAGYTENNVFAFRAGPVLWAYPRVQAPALLRMTP